RGRGEEKRTTRPPRGARGAGRQKHPGGCGEEATGVCGRGRRAMTRSGAGAGLLAVVADRLDRATIHRVDAGLDVGLVLRLLVDVAVAVVLVALEVVGRGLAAGVTVDAGVVHVELPGDVVFEFTGLVSHGVV